MHRQESKNKPSKLSLKKMGLGEYNEKSQISKLNESELKLRNRFLDNAMKALGTDPTGAAFWECLASLNDFVAETLAIK